MSFHETANSTATIPYDMNDNFLHVAQGPVTPKAGSMLEETTSTINIGSSTNRWNKGYIGGGVFADAITIASNRTLVQVTSIELSAATSQIDISGMNGDSDFNYFIVASFVTSSNAADHVRLWINGDTTASNYYSTQYAIGTINTYSFLFSGVLALNPNIRNNFINLRAKTGNLRKALLKQSDITYGDATVSIYSDTTTTLTSITFSPSVCSFGTLTSIRIYKYGMD